MRRPTRLIPLAAVATALLLVPSPASAHDVMLVAHLTADQEVPPGPAGASGHADLVVNGDTGKVCYELTMVTGIGAVTMAHIHRGAAGTNGPPVVTLDAGPAGCVSGDPAAVQDVEVNPGGYYVNLHTADFPGGAIRGQLAPAG